MRVTPMLLEGPQVYIYLSLELPQQTEGVTVPVFQLSCAEPTVILKFTKSIRLSEELVEPEIAS
jgi:hypothetical protein